MQDICCGREKEHEEIVNKSKMKALSAEELEKAGRIFFLLSEPSRLKIVLALLNGALCVHHITEISGGTTSAVSHQLRLLRDNQLVTAKKIGKNVEYSLADGHIREIVEACAAHLECAVGEEK